MIVPPHGGGAEEDGDGSMKERASAEQSIVIEWCPEAVVGLQHRVSMVG